MLLFFVSAEALILSYFLYGTIVDQIFGPDPKLKTLTIALKDGIDFTEMPTWNILLVQLIIKIQ